ncbi:MAG: penicillin-binding transpeptidase domain-containing protein [Acutalibacteraceae bacterium]|nr:penicillin-binding transpeptidase domain-containing protein [Acutalibacteraceae bacterium]
MKITAKRAGIIYALIAAFLVGIVIFVASLMINGDEWASNRANRHIYSSGTIVNAGTIYDRNGVVLAKSSDNERVFAENSDIRKAVLHAVGDTSGFISTGTHNLFRDTLSGYNRVEGIYLLKQTGTGTDITLNIDSEANRLAYKAFGNYNGVIAVYNYKTGELLCSVSKPTYDIENIPDGMLTDAKYDGVFLDKFVSGVYTPGSIMKIVTAACAIENIPDIYTRTFECDGEYETGDGSVICNGVHGKVNFQQAMNESCNCAFAEISIELGAAKLEATAKSMGFNSQLYSKEIRLVTSRFSPDKQSKAELGWAGIGQSTTLVNPAHFLSIMGAIANGGTGYAPDRIRSLGTVSQIVGRLPESAVKINPETARQLDILLRSNVEDKYGDWKFENLQMCGKTGTAQVDGAKSHSWFAGYSQRDDLPLAVICIAENGGYGSGVASDVSNKVMQYFLANIK